MLFILNKVCYAVIVMFGVILLVFLLFQTLGDPARLLVVQSGDKQTLENIRKEMRLDKPTWQQFLFYLNDVSPISYHTTEEIKQKDLRGFFIGKNNKIGIKVPYLGKSYQTKKPALAVLADALSGTIILALTAMLFAVVIGVALGTLAAVKKNTWIDNAAVLSSVAGISAPSFFVAIIVAYVFGIVLHQYTGLSITGSLYVLDEVTGEKYMVIKNLILPAFTLGIRPLAIITQLTRSSMLDVLNQDFIRTAYAKGLTKTNVILKHALPNALNPVITAVTGWFAELLAGAFFIEYIFGWKGIGKLTVDALEKLDYPIVMGAVLISALFFVVINMLADLLYKAIDPRIKTEAAT